MADRATPNAGRRRRALVTGGGGGIGAAVALALARAGHDLVLHCSGNTGGAQEVAAAARALGADVLVVTQDFTQEDAVDRLFAALAEAGGGLDILVNNAALDPGAITLADTDAATVARILAVNLRAPILCIRAAAPLMERGHGGSVVNIGSVQSWHSVSGHAAYAASKGGLDALTRQLAVELGPRGIRINSVNPGFIEVPRTVAGRPGYDRQAMGRRIPLQRVGVPDDVAEVVVFLCSLAARYLTGETITLDGGSTRCLPTHPDPMALGAPA
jgi:NAD(P)-dependent dehydrogenase (short-subunit alcohol dehydrogenase family)